MLLSSLVKALIRRKPGWLGEVKDQNLFPSLNLAFPSVKWAHAKSLVNPHAAQRWEQHDHKLLQTSSSPEGICFPVSKTTGLLAEEENNVRTSAARLSVAPPFEFPLSRRDRS